MSSLGRNERRGNGAEGRMLRTSALSSLVDVYLNVLMGISLMYAFFFFRSGANAATAFHFMSFKVGKGGTHEDVLGSMTLAISRCLD